MMKLHPFSLSPTFSIRLGLFAVLLAACTPGASAVTPEQQVDVIPSAVIQPAVPTQENSSQTTATPVEAGAPTVLPVATPRGPDLHATDPATVSLASGGLQLVEFFRFT